MHDLARGESPTTDVYLRIWDCGGQPVFLNLLPAFLTARTLFLLMFDARHNLHNPCLHLSYNKGKATEQEEEITTLQLMVQWMATIHATLLKKQSSDKKEASSIEMENFPQILPIGTHGDDEGVQARKEDIFSPFKSVCADKAFTHLLRDGFIVDNTTAGKEEFEDPAFQKIREIANHFATTDVAICTPIRWVLFRKVFERYAKENSEPIVSLEIVKQLCRECLIPEDTLTSVLAFYHDLAVFLHYSNIPSLKPVVIADPQWLIKHMAKIFALKGFEVYKNEYLWKFLREDGILVEPLYQEVLKTQNELEPQAVVDLLEHFLIVAEICTANKHQSPGRKYFVPSMLPRCPEKSTHSPTSNIHSTAPLHFIFSTNYLPPGFFTRLAAVMSKHPKCQVDFSRVYRNEVQFVYGSLGQQVDNLAITEKNFSVCVQVQRITPRSYNCPTFISTCHEIFKILQDSFAEVKKWLPGIDISCALECEKCTEKDHFIPLPAPPIINPNQVLLCQKNVPVILTADQKFWLNVQQEHPLRIKADIPDYEIYEVAKEVEKANKVKELAKALEMHSCVGDIKIGAKTLLNRWQKEMTSMSTPARPHLMIHLARIGMPELHTRLLYDEFNPEMLDEELDSNKDESKSVLLLQKAVRERDQLLDQLKPLFENVVRERDNFKQMLNQMKTSGGEEEVFTRKSAHVRMSSGNIPLTPPLKVMRLSHDTFASTADIPYTPHMRLPETGYSTYYLSPANIPPPPPPSLPPSYGHTRLPEHTHVPSECDGSESMPPHTRLSEDNHARLCEKLGRYSFKWKMIGQGLGFAPAELSTIEAMPTLLSTAPSSYLSAMLSSWLEWAPGDARGSKDYATLEALRAAVDKAGLGLTAREL